MLFRVPVNPVTRCCVVYAEPRQRPRTDGEHQPLLVEIEKVYKCGIRREIARETAAHRKYVLHPLDENRMTPRTAKGEMAIKNPCRRRRAQKRDDAPAVAIPMQSPNEQLQHAGVDDEADNSADAERQQLFQARLLHANIDCIFSAVGRSIT